MSLNETVDLLDNFVHDMRKSTLRICECDSIAQYYVAKNYWTVIAVQPFLQTYLYIYVISYINCNLTGGSDVHKCK